MRRIRRHDRRFVDIFPISWAARSADGDRPVGLRCPRCAVVGVLDRFRIPRDWKSAVSFHRIHVFRRPFVRNRLGPFFTGEVIDDGNFAVTYIGGAGDDAAHYVYFYSALKFRRPVNRDSRLPALLHRPRAVRHSRSARVHLQSKTTLKSRLEWVPFGCSAPGLFLLSQGPSRPPRHR